MNIITVDEEVWKHLNERLKAISEYILKLEDTSYDSLWLNNHEVCQYLHISEKTLWRMRTNGQIAFSKMYGQYYYTITVGNLLRTTLTPMTFSRPRFNGVQIDFMADKYAGTILASRISDPILGATQEPERRTNTTTMFGGRGTIQIGDTFTTGETIRFTGIPHFAPELFRRIRLTNPMKTKALQKGLQQLSEEGSTQVFSPLINSDLIVGAVGQLQFDVVAYRLADEYKVEAIYEPVNIYTARWIEAEDERQLEEFRKKAQEHLSEDGGGYLTYLAPTRVNLSLMEERWPDIRFRETREH